MNLATGGGTATNLGETLEGANAPAAAQAVRKSSHLIITAALLLLILLAFFLRLYALERQSMWSDEGLSYYRATLPTAEILKGLIVIDGVETKDTNPPLYFLLLHGWESLTGDSIFALRHSGVLAGTLAVPLIFILGSLIYGRWVGLAAAFLMAISPFHIWQSQILRNYSLLMTLNLASVYGLFRFALTGQDKRSARWLILWLTAGLLGIYTHYFGFFVFVFGLAILAVWLVWRWKISRLFRQKWFWIVLFLGLIILVPAVVISWERFRAGQQFDFHRLPWTQVMVHAAGAFGVGVEPTLSHPFWRFLPALLLAFLGLAIGLGRRRLPTVFLLGYQLVPLGLMLLLSIINPLYNGIRHLLIGLPPFLLFVANGAVGYGVGDAVPASKGLWRSPARILLFLLFIVVVVIQFEWLYRQFVDPALLRDDIRGVAEYLNQVAAEDDLIILHDTIIALTLDYYYDGAAEVQAIPALYEHDVTAAQQAFEEAASEADRIWFLARPTPRTGFPRRELWDWAEAKWPRFFDMKFPSMWLRVELVGLKPQPLRDHIPSSAIAIEATFGDELQLHGLEMPAAAKAGEPWWATFYWSRLDGNQGDYSLSLRLVDENGQVWAQDDELLWPEFPAAQWPAKAIVSHDLAITMPSGVPPGDYDLWLRVLDSNRQPLLVNDGQADMLLGHMAMTAGTDIAGLPAIAEQRARLGPVDLLGYHLPTEKIRPGHALPVQLFWRVRSTPPEDYLLNVELVDPMGEVIAVEQSAPTRESYPPSQWQTDELLQSNVLVNVPASADEGPHTIKVAFISPATGKPIAEATLQEPFTVDPWPFVGELPADMEDLDAQFGDPAMISLAGYDLAASELKPGESLDLTLYWQAFIDVNEPYYIFIHLVDEDDNIAAQVDRAPVQGFRPTISWRKGEVITDEYMLPVGTDIAPGTYHLWVGLFNPDTWERPLTQVDGQWVPEQRVYLGEIVVGQGE